jgi:hypothetical protein
MNLCKLRNEMFQTADPSGNSSVLNIYYDGAQGTKKIANVLSGYRKFPKKGQ